MISISQLRRYAFISIIRALAAFLTVLVSFGVTKTLDIEKSGLLFISKSILIILVTFGCLGMRDSFVRLISGYYNEKNYAAVKGIFNTGIISSLIVCIITGVILYLSSDMIAKIFFNNQFISPLLKTISFILIPFTVLQLICSAFQGRQQYLRSIFFNNVTVNSIIFNIFFFFSVQTENWTH